MWVMTSVVIALLTSCVGQEIIMRPEDDDKVTFTGDEITRVSGNQWEKNDEIVVSMYNSTMTSIVDGFELYRYKASTAGITGNFIKVNNDMYFPGKSTVNFRAIYPSTIASSLNVANDCVVWNNLMVAQTTWDISQGTNVPLNFKYALAKIIITVKAGIGSPDLSGIGIQLMDIDDKFKITKDGTVTSTKTSSFGNTQDFIYSTSTTMYQYIAPQNTGPNGYLSIWGNSFNEIQIPFKNIILEAKEYSFSITIDGNTAELSSQISITERDSGTLSDITI